MVFTKNRANMKKLNVARKKKEESDSVGLVGGEGCNLKKMLALGEYILWCDQNCILSGVRMKMLNVARKKMEEGGSVGLVWRGGCNLKKMIMLGEYMLWCDQNCILSGGIHSMVRSKSHLVWVRMWCD